MSLKQELIDLIVDFITKRKVKTLEKAFMANPKIVSSIKNMHTAYESMEKQISDFCKKYPDACKDAQKTGRR